MKKLAIFFLATVIVACDQKKDDLIKKIAIDSGIKIYSRENLNTKQLVLFCQTEKNFPCVNYPIQTEQNFNKDNQLREVLKIRFFNFFSSRFF